MPVKLLQPRRFEDERGWFSETYNQRREKDLGLDVVFVQDNHSMSRPVGVLRGLHFQAPPHGQGKLVRCLRGRIWDVAVDVREGSPTYAQWVDAELSAENGRQLYVPVGFAHGFITLEPDTEVEYKVTDFYDRDSEGGLMWNDPTLALPWPLPPGGPVLSDKDQVLPTLAEFKSPFAYDGVPLAPLEQTPIR
ncbi:MAG TPA: dTDP-4-dehydrorhamnose 3,5-epimerase [Caulobacteraceae bacterium]|jgi:dTDP-4-dehydrorhamnose 3,5-epimerase|nr:dTDP-4-dehydrorhamnose 3,5-epimerase [Caulobacteraceae bacterium]